MPIRKTKARRSARRNAPITVNGSVPLRRIESVMRRPREYLTLREVGLLMGIARERGSYGHRDATMILAAYHHGLRSGELCALRSEQIDLGNDLLHVHRLKNDMLSVHPMGGNEIRALRKLKREEPQSRYVFNIERLAPMMPAGFCKMLTRIRAAAKFPFPVHPHMLRHACGYKLANDGQDTRAVSHPYQSAPSF
jgi:integrase